MAVAREACTIFRAIVWLIWEPYAAHAAHTHTSIHFSKTAITHAAVTINVLKL